MQMGVTGWGSRLMDCESKQGMKAGRCTLFWRLGSPDFSGDLEM